MKKITSILLSVVMLVMLVVPAYAEETVWNLTEKPDFSSYFLNTYGYLKGDSPVLFEMSEAEYSNEEIKGLTQKVLNVIDAVEFVPGDYTNYKSGDEIILAYFTVEDWKTDLVSDIIHLYVTDKGLCFQIWNRSSSSMKTGAFIDCSTNTIAAEIYEIMSDTSKRVDELRAEKDSKVEQETEEKEEIIASFQKISYIKTKSIDLYNKSGSKISIGFQTGICSYQLSENSEINYAFYFNFGEKPDLYYICDDVEENVSIYTDKRIYESKKDSQKYCIFEGEKQTPRIETKIEVDADGVVEEIYIHVKNSGHSATITKNELTQVGLFESVDGLAIIKKDPEKEIIEETEENEDKTLEETEPDSPVNEEKEETKEPEKEVEQEKESEDVKEEENKTEQEIKEVSYADALNMLGLFRGTDGGYDLESHLTRAQGATMLVRLLGKEKEALGEKTEGVFSDVPSEHWAAPYVEYCYKNSITKGTGDSKYSPDDYVSGSQFVTLVLRALGYTDTEPQTAQAVSYGCGLLSAKKSNDISQIVALDRETMVYIAYRALITNMTNGERLIENLIKNGVVEKTTAQQLGIVE